MELKNLKLDVAVLKEGALILRAVNNKLRQQMLQLIDKMQNVTVTEIYIKLRIEQSVASQHLAILRNAGFVNTERDGKFIYYSVNYNRLKQVEKLSKDLIDQKIPEITS